MSRLDIGSAQDQMEHGIGLLRDYERNPKPEYLAAGLASALWAIWRKVDETDTARSGTNPRQ